MRKFTLRRAGLPLLIAAFFLKGMPASSQVGQTLWQFANPKPFGFTVLSSSFIDNNNGLMVGDGGGIAKTSDGGLTWAYFGWYTLVPSLNKPTFNEVQMVTSSVAYTCGTGSVLLKSVDGGINWSRVATPMDASGVEITSLSFTDANNGIIVGEPIGGNVAAGKASLYKTTDGGASWTLMPNLPKLPAVRTGTGTVASPFYYDSTRAKSLYRVRMLSPTLGYVSGAAGLLWKYDGTSWKDYSATNFRMGLDTLASSTRPVTGPQQQSYRGLAIVSDTLAVITSQSNGVIIQVNTAKDTARPRLRNWSGNPALSPLGLGVAALWDVAKAPDGKLVVATASSGAQHYILSEDGGATWKISRVYPIGSGYEGLQLYTAAVTPNQRYLFGGTNGVIADSSAGNWRFGLYYNANLGSGSYNVIRFATTERGITAGGFGAIAITKNSGVTWVDKTNLTDQANLTSYYAMSYYKPDSLWIATSNGKLRFSGDQAETWDEIFADTMKPTTNSSNPVFYAMDWLNSQRGWVASYRGNGTTASTVIFRTTNGGATWDSTKTFPAGSATPQFRKIVFSNPRVGYASSNKASIWKTTDGGINWTRVYKGNDSASVSFPGLSVVDSNTVYVAGTSGRVMRTIDGGANWIDAKGNLSTSLLNGITAYDALQAFVFTNTGLVWYTADGGKVWGLHSAPISGFGAIFFDGVFTSILPGCGQPVCNTLWAVAGRNIMRLGSDQILPVKVGNLTAAAATGGNILFWTALEQAGVKYYEAEASVNGRDFTVVSEKISPKGASYEAYNWLHKNAAAATQYYRVKATEKDGGIFYTNIVKVNGRQSAAWNHTVTSSALALYNTKVDAGQVLIKVINSAGQQIAAKSWNQPGGSFSETLLLPANTFGVHFVQVFNNGNSQTFKVFVPKQ